MSSIGEKYTKWIINNVKLEEYIKTAIIKGKEIDALKSEGKIENVENEFNLVSKLTNIPITKEILDYLKGVKNVEIIRQDKQTNLKVNEVIMTSVIEEVRTKFSDKLVLKLPYKLNYEQIRVISQEVWRRTNKLVFIICPTMEVSGRIVTDHNCYENIELVRGYKKETDNGTMFIINMIGDVGSKTKGLKCNSNLNMRLHKYSFISDDFINYILFSEQPLSLGRCVLVGTQIPIHDRRKIGEEAKNRTMIDLLMVTEHKPFILNITKDEVLEFRKFYKTHDDLAKRMFGEMRHPTWFEKLMFCINVTNNNYDYPAHFIIIGPAGSGKTRGLLKPLKICFDEIAGIVSGTSTIKGLIPSFKESPPDIGHLCRAEKIALVDEMFNFVKSSMKQGEQNSFGILKDVLDHEDKSYASGNGTINTVMNSIMIAVTNEDKYNGLTTVASICEKLDKPFLSRLLIYKQTEQHIEFVNNRKDDVGDLGDDAYPKLNQEFLSIFNWLKNEKVKGYNSDKSKIIFNKYLNTIPGSTREVYQGRYRHHLKCIVAGVCKYRWLLSKKEDLIFDDVDYVIGEELFSNVISSWIEEDVDIQKLPIRARLTRVGFKEKLIYDFLCKEKLSVNEYVSKLQSYLELSKTEIEYSIVKLLRWEILKVVDVINQGEFYTPFWYGESKRGDDDAKC